MEKRTSRRVRALQLIGIAALCVLSGLMGGAFTNNFGTSSYTLSYADFISIMLTAISLLMTVLAIFLAVAGFMGWSTIEQKIHTRTEDFLSKGFQSGGRLERIVVAVIERKTEEIMFAGVTPVEEVGGNDENGNDESQNNGAAV